MDYYKMMPVMINDYDKARQHYEDIKSMYPMKIKRILKLVEYEVDKYDYFASFIYDEVIDKVTVYGMVGRVLKRSKEDNIFGRDADEELYRMIIEILVYNEIFSRKEKRSLKWY